MSLCAHQRPDERCIFQAGHDGICCWAPIAVDAVYSGMLCDNPKCAYHVQLPHDERKRAHAHVVEEDAVTTRVDRYKWVIGKKSIMLCDVCHEAAQLTKAQT